MPRLAFGPLMRFGWALATPLLATTLLFPVRVSAQSAEPLLDTDIPVAVPSVRNVTVAERPRPELTPQGVHAGGFRLYPELGLEPGYTSNALGLSAAPSSDAVLFVRPGVRAQSQWSRHALGLVLEYNARRYATVTAKNENGFRLHADGRLDVHGESSLSAALGYERVYEEQYAGSFPANGGASIAVRHPSAQLRGTFVANRLRLVTSADWHRFNYADSRTLSGASLDQDYRDHRVLRTSIRPEYLLMADSAAFLQATYRRTIYDQRSSGLTDRSSREFRLVAGVVGDVTPIIRAAIGVGYADRRYDQPGRRAVRDIVADIRLDYNLTALTTVSLTGRRGIEESSVPNTGGYVASKLGVRVDHELLRNLLLNAGVDRETDSFKGIARTDRLTRFSAGASYSLSRNIVIAPGFDFVRRKSRGDSPGQSFKEARFVLRTSFRL